MRAWKRFRRLQSPPSFMFGLWEKTRADRSAHRYRPAFDGFRGSDSMVRTYAGGLRIGVEDVLISIPNTVFSLSKKPGPFFKTEQVRKTIMLESAHLSLCTNAHDISDVRSFQVRSGPRISGRMLRSILICTVHMAHSGQIIIAAFAVRFTSGTESHSRQKKSRIQLTFWAVSRTAMAVPLMQKPPHPAKQNEQTD